MTKKDMLEEMLADMANASQKERFLNRGLKKSKEQIMNIYNLWLKDKENSQFYRSIING